ncbi:glycine-rich cell wall structural protein-like [Durio zibethinus]|uniref:Glycine-rich cell wall structural protein-like n=1 Tax=Durio zibethinus TaxID=66656 RepID=A0A6P6A7F1_DURZI|nr:glycine-rich cell wall structural protein-like [Durio zibethinus]
MEAVLLIEVEIPFLSVLIEVNEHAICPWKCKVSSFPCVLAQPLLHAGGGGLVGGARGELCGSHKLGRGAGGGLSGGGDHRLGGGARRGLGGGLGGSGGIGTGGGIGGGSGFGGGMLYGSGGGPEVVKALVVVVLEVDEGLVVVVELVELRVGAGGRFSKGGGVGGGLKGGVGGSFGVHGDAGFGGGGGGGGH